MKRLILIIIFGFISLVVFKERDASEIFSNTNNTLATDGNALICHVTLFNSDFIIPIGKFKKSIKAKKNSDNRVKSNLINSMRKGLVWTLGLVDKTQKERRKLRGNDLIESFRIQVGFWDTNTFNSKRVFAPVWSFSNQIIDVTDMEFSPQGIKPLIQQFTCGYLAIEIMHKGAWLETKRLNRYRIIYRFKSRRRKNEYFPVGEMEAIQLV